MHSDATFLRDDSRYSSEICGSWDKDDRTRADHLCYYSNLFISPAIQFNDQLRGFGEHNHRRQGDKKEITSLVEARCHPFSMEFVEMEMLESNLMQDGQELTVVENVDEMYDDCE